MLDATSQSYLIRHIVLHNEQFQRRIRVHLSIKRCVHTLAVLCARQLGPKGVIDVCKNQSKPLVNKSLLSSLYWSIIPLIHARIWLLLRSHTLAFFVALLISAYSIYQLRLSSIFLMMFQKHKWWRVSWKTIAIVP